MKDKKKKSILRCELETYRSEGIQLLLNGKESSPKEIVKAHKIAEQGFYMRDYVPNEKGELKCLEFDFVKTSKP